MNSYEFDNELENELSNLQKEIGDGMIKAKEDYINRLQDNLNNYQYYVGYSIYSSEGKFDGFNACNFFIDREIKTLEDVFYLDHCITGAIELDEGYFIRVVSYSRLEHSGTHKLVVENYAQK